MTALFPSLHANEPINFDQHNVINDLQNQEDSKMQSRPLDYFITETVKRTAVKTLKNNTSPFSDKVKNEMIKAVV